MNKEPFVAHPDKFNHLAGLLHIELAWHPDVKKNKYPSFALSMQKLNNIATVR